MESPLFSFAKTRIQVLHQPQTTLAIRNAGGSADMKAITLRSADMKAITLNKLGAKPKVKCLEIPHYA